MLLTPEQIRAARALLRMDQEELARRANVSVVTVRRLEAPDGLSKVTLGTFDEIQRALEAAGAEFVDRGVRRRAWTPEEIGRRRRRIFEIADRSAALQGAPALHRRRSLRRGWAVIAVDSSAIIAILRGEPDGGRFADAITDADAACMSAVSLQESSMVLAGRTGDAVLWLPLDELIRDMNLEIVAHDADLARIAREAFLRFGKGRHPRAAELWRLRLVCSGEDTRRSPALQGRRLRQNRYRSGNRRTRLTTARLGGHTPAHGDKGGIARCLR